MTTLTQLSTKAPTLCDRPEVELLLCCARTHIEPKTAARIRTLLEQDIDWAYLIQTAARHGVIPLLYQSLSSTCPEAVPKAILSQLRNYFHTNAQRNLFLSKELLLLLELFDKHSIPAVPFKGLVLAAEAYGNLALRQICDLDILVHERDFIRTKELLISQGYRMLNTSEHEAIFLQAQLLREDGLVNVDLHYGIPGTSAKLFEINTEPFWERLEQQSLAGTRILTLSPEDHLLVLCVEEYKDYGKMLAKHCNVAELIRANPHLDWDRFIQQVRTLRIKQIVYSGLLLVHEIVGTTLPSKILQTVKAAPVRRWLVTKMREGFFYDVDSLTKTSQSHPSYLWSIGRLNLYEILMMDSLRKRVGYCLSSVITPTKDDQTFLPLPASLSSLYYLVRPIRLVEKWGLNPVKRLLGF
jgi:hypothetical protein